MFIFAAGYVHQVSRLPKYNNFLKNINTIFFIKNVVKLFYKQIRKYKTDSFI